MDNKKGKKNNTFTFCKLNFLKNENADFLHKSAFFLIFL